MQKIGVLIALSIIGFASAQYDHCKPADLRTLDFCCYQRGLTTFDDVYDKYFAQAEEEGDEDPQICASQNTFIETKLANAETGGVDYVVLKQMLEDNGLAPELVNHMLMTVQICDGLVAEQLRHAPALEEKCSQAPNLLRQCAAINGMRNCPVSRFSEDLECRGMLNYYKDCPYKL